MNKADKAALLLRVTAELDLVEKELKLQSLGNVLKRIEDISSNIETLYIVETHNVDDLDLDYDENELISEDEIWKIWK